MLHPVGGGEGPAEKSQVSNTRDLLSVIYMFKMLLDILTSDASVVNYEQAPELELGLIIFDLVHFLTINKTENFRLSIPDDKTCRFITCNK